MNCSGSLKKVWMGYQWQAALALVGPIYNTSVEYTIFAGMLCWSMNLGHEGSIYLYALIILIHP